MEQIDFAFIDSGTGGLPYMIYLMQKSPSSKCVYVGDTKNFPYGEKTHDQIVEAVLKLCTKIIDKFAPKVIVIACNTMSVNTLDICREKFPSVKFVGTVPAIKLAASVSKKRCIGLLATNSTVNHPYNRHLMEEFASDCKLVLRGDPELISFIEHKSFTATEEEKKAAIIPAVEYFKKEGSDVIILGCTHFLNLAGDIQKACGDSIKVVDSKEGVVKRCLSVLEVKSSSSQTVKPSLYVTGFAEKKDESEYKLICERFNLTWCSIL